MCWNVGDFFDANEITILAGDMKPTKRYVVAIVGKFYKLLGFFSAQCYNLYYYVFPRALLI